MSIFACTFALDFKNRTKHERQNLQRPKTRVCPAWVRRQHSYGTGRDAGRHLAGNGREPTGHRGRPESLSGRPAEVQRQEGSGCCGQDPEGCLRQGRRRREAAQGRRREATEGVRRLQERPSGTASADTSRRGQRHARMVQEGEGGTREARQGMAGEARCHREGQERERDQAQGHRGCQGHGRRCAGCTDPSRDHRGQGKGERHSRLDDSPRLRRHHRRCRRCQD